MDDYLDTARRLLPIVDRVIGQQGDIRISDYLNTITVKSGPSYQQRDDLIEVIYQYARPLLEESIAKRAAVDFAECPIALTVNHHGVDSFAQSVQGSLIYSLRAITGESSSQTILIFSFGNVPLNNLTYPRGVLLYHVNPDQLDMMPQKLPVFPVKSTRHMVSVSAPYTASMIQRSFARLDRMVKGGEVSSTLAGPLKEIFQQNYLADDVLNLPSYSRQSVILNNRIWKRLFMNIGTIPEMVYLEIEKVVGKLLESDLSNPKSLAGYVMFEPRVRNRILDSLDGVRGCWNRKNLDQRLRKKNPRKQVTQSISCGTVFFWGVDLHGRRIPLNLKSTKAGGRTLCGIDDFGNFWEMPYTFEAIIKGLRENKLLPSLFTCFLVLAFARGVICLGGYYQGEYLPSIQKRVVEVLNKTDRLQDIAQLVSQVPTNRYLSGMLGIMTRIEGKNYLVPSGIAEIISGGGITLDDINKIKTLTMRDAHLAALIETLPDADPKTYAKPGWKKEMAKGCYRLLKAKIVVK